MDSTIIGCECLDELADFAGVKERVAAITERAMAGEIDFEGALRERVGLLAGLEMAALQAAYETGCASIPARAPWRGPWRRTGRAACWSPAASSSSPSAWPPTPASRRTGPTPSWTTARG